MTSQPQLPLTAGQPELALSDPKSTKRKEWIKRGVRLLKAFREQQEKKDSKTNNRKDK